MNLPFGMRPSTLVERRRFYESFDIQKARDWVGRPLIYAVVIGRHTQIYPERFQSKKDHPLIIDSYRTLQDVTRLLLDFNPEGVYYDRNYYKDISLCHAHDLQNSWDWENFSGQQLAFDLDPENVTCPIHGTLQDRFDKGLGLSFCETAFGIARENTLQLYDLLTGNYSDVRIVFSGRGFHLHVFDDDVRLLTQPQRKKIADEYARFGIDKWVTESIMRLIRLPYSLNGVSSRIVTPLDKARLTSFNPEVEACPSFL